MPFCLAGPWQRMQEDARIGWTSRTKSGGASAGGAGVPRAETHVAHRRAGAERHRPGLQARWAHPAGTAAAAFARREVGVRAAGEAAVRPGAADP